jgi:hypothetical protein
MFLNIVEEKTKLTREKQGMTEYLKLKLEQEDWHGVADAAMDIRELVANLVFTFMYLDIGRPNMFDLFMLMCVKDKYLKEAK